jgi:hypothetical protein
MRPRLPATLIAVAVLAVPAVAAADQPPISRSAPGLGAASPDALKGAPAAKAPSADQYIVELAAPPLARYQGGAKGFAPTAPAATGDKLDADSQAAHARSRELSDRQDAALRAAAPGVKPTAQYRTAFAGFAARLTDQQAQALRTRPEVAHVTRERFLPLLDTGSAKAAAAGGIGGSALMGLPGGLWKRLGWPAKAGRGVIVGVVDSGITPESASFADPGLPAPGLWDGACQAGEKFPSSTREQGQGKVVLCDAFAPSEVIVDTLRPLGAKGFIIAGGDDLDDPIVHSALPSAVIERHELAPLRAVTDAGGGTARMQAPAARATGWTADRMAGFSSRGPASTTADLLRPDVAAADAGRRRDRIAGMRCTSDPRDYDLVVVQCAGHGDRGRGLGFVWRDPAR